MHHHVPSAHGHPKPSIPDRFTDLHQNQTKMPGLTIGDTIPNLDVDTTHGRMKLHDYIGDSWAVLFSHPADLTPVCTAELGKMALYAPEFEKRGVKLLGFSCHAVPSHLNWIGDVESYAPGCEVSYSYPIVADPTREVIRQLNMVDPEAMDADGAELPSRALHVVAGDKRIKLSIVYPATTGRDLDEVLRVVDSLQATAKYRVATPVDWRPGQPVVVFPSVTTEEAQKMFPRGYTTVDLPSKKEYLRLTKL